MIKKLIKLFKKTKTKKRVVVNKKDKAEIINFVNKAKKTNKIQTEKMEIRKMDNLAKELVENYLKASRRSFLDMGYCFYLFLFRILQRMIFEFSFPIYRHYLKTASKEIINNHKQWLHEFKEWDEAPTITRVSGEKKLDDENNTIH